MPTIKVKIVNEHGEPMSGWDVTLYYSGLTGGFGDKEWSDDNGMTYHETDDYRSGDVYVDGNPVAKWNTSNKTYVVVRPYG